MSRWDRVQHWIEVAISILVPLSIAAFLIAFVIFLEQIGEAALEGRIQ